MGEALKLMEKIAFWWNEQRRMVDRQTRLVDKESRLGIPLVYPHRFLIEVFCFFVFILFYLFCFVCFVCFVLFCCCFILFFVLTLLFIRNMIASVDINKKGP